jgi:dihydrofolate reductase
MAGDALLLGRVTYERFAAAWPSMTDEAGFADRMNNLPKHVVSTTLDQLSWNNARLITSDIPDAVTKLKQQPGQDILVFGSGQLFQTLWRHDLIDEYRLMLFPVVLGNGKRLFQDATRTTLKRVETRTFKSGVVVLTDQPAPKP